jgi:hypothetical protein
VTTQREEQNWKDVSPILSIEDGMQMDESDEQETHAEVPMDGRLEPNSNVSTTRDSHRSKQASRTFSTDEGTQNEERDEQPEKAERSIHESLEPDSKVTVERRLHSQQQYSPSALTEAGMQRLRRLVRPRFGGEALDCSFRTGMGMPPTQSKPRGNDREAGSEMT